MDYQQMLDHHRRQLSGYSDYLRRGNSHGRGDGGGAPAAPNGRPRSGIPTPTRGELQQAQGGRPLPRAAPLPAADDPVEAYVDARLRGVGHYTVSAGDTDAAAAAPPPPDAMYAKSQEWRQRRQRRVEALRRELEASSLSECTFTPTRAGPRLTPRGGSNNSSGNYSATHADPALARHAARLAEARRRREEAQRRLEGADGSGWTGALTVPVAPRLGLRGANTSGIASLRQPCGPPPLRSPDASPVRGLSADPASSSRPWTLGDSAADDDDGGSGGKDFPAPPLPVADEEDEEDGDDSGKERPFSDAPRLLVEEEYAGAPGGGAAPALLGVELEAPPLPDSQFVEDPDAATDALIAALRAQLAARDAIIDEQRQEILELADELEVFRNALLEDEEEARGNNNDSDAKKEQA